MTSCLKAHIEKQLRNDFFGTFSDEVRHLYRAFKQECPNGIVDEETFKEVYEKIFPLGDASQYAHLVFAAIDRFGNEIYSPSHPPS